MTNSRSCDAVVVVVVVYVVVPVTGWKGTAAAATAVGSAATAAVTAVAVIVVVGSRTADSVVDDDDGVIGRRRFRSDFVRRHPAVCFSPASSQWLDRLSTKFRRHSFSSSSSAAAGLQTAHCANTRSLSRR